MKTTEFLKANESFVANICHDRIGPIIFTDVLSGMGQEGFQSIKFIHNDLIPPKTTVGIHQHTGETFEEWYYCIEGSGTMHLDGEDYEMKSGDIAVCRGGGCHGISNDSDGDMRIIVICAMKS